jgi:hypothetical protein
MRLILSRKGLDSSSGGCPSPVLPDGSLVSLPIPDKRSPVRYADLTWRNRNLGDVVAELTGGKVRREFRAHLDPDVREELLPHVTGWRPALGQHGAAQGHLRNHGVGVGDLFLFWGLFRRVDEDLRWSGAPEHRVWGWLQVAEVAPVDAVVRRATSSWAWASRHPHLAFAEDATNTLYVAAERLRLPGLGRRGIPGAGSIDVTIDRHRLTECGAPRASHWTLPIDFLPGGRPPLTYHRDLARWCRQGDAAHLQVAARGQEFVLDLDLYPGVAEWAIAMIATI